LPITQVVTPCEAEGESRLVPGDLAVVVAVDVDEARRDDRARGVDGARRGAGAVPDGHDAPVAHGHVGPAGGSAGAVDEGSAGDLEVVIHDPQEYTSRVGARVNSRHQRISVRAVWSRSSMWGQCPMPRWTSTRPPGGRLSMKKLLPLDGSTRSSSPHITRTGIESERRSSGRRQSAVLIPARIERIAGREKPWRIPHA
jgi:hypothetical protein